MTAFLPPLRVPVPGGELTVHQLGGDERCQRTLIALHGITANGMSMRPLARAIAATDSGLRVLAPDLAGRACSNAVIGPWGIGRHAEDVIAIADAIDAERVTVLGHSMGAYVAAAAASRRPERFDRVVLVDGGIAFPPPPGADIDTLLTAVIGPAMTRLSMTFPNTDAYLSFMAANPAVAEVRNAGGSAAADLRAYLEHDIVHRPDGTLASSCALEAIRVDGGAVLTEPETLTAAPSLAVPATLLWAPRGLMNQTPGLLTAEAIEAARLPNTVTVTAVPDCNHYSIMFAEHALDAVLRGILG